MEGLISHQADGAEGFAWAGDQFLDPHLFREGSEGETHQLSNIDDRNPVTDVVGFFNLPLTTIKIGLAERAGDSDGIGARLLCRAENIVGKFKDDVRAG